MEFDSKCIDRNIPFPEFASLVPSQNLHKLITYFKNRIVLFLGSGGSDSEASSSKRSLTEHGVVLRVPITYTLSHIELRVLVSWVNRIVNSSRKCQRISNRIRNFPVSKLRTGIRVTYNIIYSNYTGWLISYKYTGCLNNAVTKQNYEHF